jgi:hypothetical protein
VIAAMMVGCALAFALGFGLCLAMWRQDERMRSHLPGPSGRSMGLCLAPECPYAGTAHYRHAPEVLTGRRARRAWARQR